MLTTAELHLRCVKTGFSLKRGNFKATTDSDHTFNTAPSLLNADFVTDKQRQKRAADTSLK